MPLQRAKPKVQPIAAAKPEGAPYASFGEVYQKARQMQGEHVSVKDLVESGRQFVVKAHSMRHSQYEGKESYAAVQIEIDGKPYFFNTASEALIDQLERTAKAVPYNARILQKTSGTGKKYLTLA